MCNSAGFGGGCVAAALVAAHDARRRQSFYLFIIVKDPVHAAMHVEEHFVSLRDEAEDRVVRGPSQRRRRRVEQPFQGREGDAVASQREAYEGVVPPGRVVDDGEEAQSC